MIILRSNDLYLNQFYFKCLEKMNVFCQTIDYGQDPTLLLLDSNGMLTHKTTIKNSDGTDELKIYKNILKMLGTKRNNNVITNLPRPGGEFTVRLFKKNNPPSRHFIYDMSNNSFRSRINGEKIPLYNNDDIPRINITDGHGLEPVYNYEYEYKQGVENVLNEKIRDLVEKYLNNFPFEDYN